MAKTILHTATTRGHAAHGWLDSHHTFSFAGYYNPDRMNFGVLRVLNDDIVTGGRGFDTHPHDNMEIISIPLEGDLKHKDNLGNEIVIKQGDIQVMSTGTGVFHSEYNANADRPAKFLQIWVFPNQLNVIPRYDQITPDLTQKNQLHQVLSPYPEDAGTWIYQRAWFNIGRFDKDFATTYHIQQPGNGVYAFVIKGRFNINGQELNARDGFGIWDTDSFSLTALESDAEILLMDVPLKP